MSRPDFQHRQKLQRGMTLIEAMVGMVVGLLVALTAAGTAQVFTASQRQGMGAGSVAMNATTAMTAIRQDLGQAGLGFFGEGLFLCDTINLSTGNAVLEDGSVFTPVNAERPGTGLTDKLHIAYATHIAGGTAVLTENEVSDGSSVRLRSLLPGVAGEAVLLSASAAQRACTVRTITGVIPATTESSMLMVFDPDGLHNSNAVTFTLPPNIPDQSSVALLGNLRMNSYQVENKTLVQEQRLTGRKSVLAGNVVAFRIEYGVSAAEGATSLSGWQNPNQFGKPTAANISRLRAVRIGLVTRSTQREKTNKNGVCEASLVRPRLFDTDIVDPDPEAAGNDWRCYRYRVASAVVPLRNVAIGLSGAKLDITTKNGKKVNL
jgi:type IV pilus assembly protein PilW